MEQLVGESSPLERIEIEGGQALAYRSNAEPAAAVQAIFIDLVHQHMTQLDQ